MSCNGISHLPFSPDCSCRPRVSTVDDDGSRSDDKADPPKANTRGIAVVTSGNIVLDVTLRCGIPKVARIL